MKKTLLSFLLVFLVSVFWGTENEIVEASKKDRDDYTFGEVEQILLSYLKENGFNFAIGSNEFHEYVINQMQEDKDQELANKDDYHLIVTYMSEYLYRLTEHETEQQNNQIKEPFNMEKFHQITLGEMKEEIKKEEEEAEKAAAIYKATNPITIYSTLNLANARAYAKQYYQNYNNQYPVFSKDCTNFVSQILQAGGRSQVVKPLATEELVSDTQYWFIKSLPNYKWSRSSSWTVVEDLYAHLIRTSTRYQSSSKADIIANAKPGDVIQFKKSTEDRFSHSMWVYDKIGGDLKLSGHTNDYWDRSFNDISGYATYRIIKMPF